MAFYADRLSTSYIAKIRAVVTNVHTLSLPAELAHSRLVSAVVRGIHRRHPRPPPRQVTVDSASVLRHLEGMGPNDALSTAELRAKCALLLILGHQLRFIDMAGINLAKSHWKGGHLGLAYLGKTAVVRYKLAKLPPFPARPLLCVVSAISCLLTRIGPGVPLFRHLHSSAALSARSISRAVMSVLVAAGLDTAWLRAYDVRATGTSHLLGVPGVGRDDVKLHGGWSLSSQVMEVDYDRRLGDVTQYAGALGLEALPAVGL